MGSEIRKDYLQDKYALIAPRRGKRPGDEVVCPFCPENLSKKQVIKTYGKPWKVAVLKNLYPAFTMQKGGVYGRQEIVVETPYHTRKLYDLPVADIAEVIKVYADRVKEMKKDKRIKYILVFNNSGVTAGASKAHEHSQVIGMNFVSPYLLDKTEKEHRFQGKTGRCIYCDIIKKEEIGPRKIFSDNNIFVFAPYASQYAYEARIYPRRHLDNVANLTNEERASIASALKNILMAVGALKVPYNFYMHERTTDADQHFYIKITPRGAALAGVELGTGLIINPVTPEAAAKYYRNNFKRTPR
jgi:UDPglucose--hexose-1-phosphate uridylyltransferase